MHSCHCVVDNPLDGPELVSVHCPRISTHVRHTRESESQSCKTSHNIHHHGKLIHRTEAMTAQITCTEFKVTLPIKHSNVVDTHDGWCSAGQSSFCHIWYGTKQHHGCIWSKAMHSCTFHKLSTMSADETVHCSHDRLVLQGAAMASFVVSNGSHQWEALV